MKLTRNLYIPYIDTSGKGGGAGATWVRIDKSTKFDLALNPQDDTKAYIDAKNDSTIISSYQPELPEEIVLESTNPCYKYVYGLVKAMPVGSDAVVPVLVLMPQVGIASETVTAETVFDAILWRESILELDTLSSTDGTLSFSLKLNGATQVGTAKGVGGTVTFTPGTGASA